MPSVIAFREVTARYRGATAPAVSGVTCDAVRGAVTALAGPNGSGKSTLVRALLRRIPLASGEIHIDEQALAAIDRRAFARRVAVVTQREEAPFPQPVREYVALGRYPHQGPWRYAAAEDERAVARAIELAGIGALADRGTGELSGGEWQRARIARALARLPKAERETLELAYYGGLTDTEVSERLAEPEATIRRRLLTGLSDLQRLLAHPGPTGSA